MAKDSTMNLISKEVSLLEHGDVNEKVYYFEELTTISLEELNSPPASSSVKSQNIIKKLYKNSIPVACEIISEEDFNSMSKRIKIQIGILLKLKECPYVIKISGLCDLGDSMKAMFCININ